MPDYHCDIKSDSVWFGHSQLKGGDLDVSHAHLGDAQ